jgi:hypothetical protein
VTRVTVSEDGVITVHLALTFVKHGGRKAVITPDGSAWVPRPRVDNAMVKALARAFRWQRMLDEGVCATIEELAKREKVNRGYMCRVLQLTLLAPDLVELILEDGQGPQVNLTQLLDSVEVGWEAQRLAIAGQA